MKIRRNKLQILKKLALYATRSPAQVKLDRLWGFKPENPKRRKTRHTTRVSGEHKRLNAKEYVNKVLESCEPENEPEKPTVKEPEVQQQGKRSLCTRKPWETDPEVQKQKRTFKEAVNQLHKLVYPHLDPIAKRQYDNAKLQALGGKIAKNRKMPYKEFVQRTKALKRNVEKNQQLEKELGVKLFTDTKGGARFVDIQKRKRRKEIKQTRSPFQFGDKNGVYRIKTRT
ncbi:uncharacterized protein BXIN_0772 [Babesia sp. Xinjiang]|uniref:uncharacterized protein n=1 Tax=Babesia sp. Xinjiang TaxID=462227 RepID=UPI000A22BCC7|nr:uncharacterized protein BXIN_0772 [Babesia sp. Xinjiang]ORM41333.1 hypothetical protein BXIN_0772 [Babesia sp. Xinjiang]